MPIWRERAPNKCSVWINGIIKIDISFMATMNTVTRNIFFYQGKERSLYFLYTLVRKKYMLICANIHTLIIHMNVF